ERDARRPVEATGERAGDRSDGERRAHALVAQVAIKGDEERREPAERVAGHADAATRDPVVQPLLTPQQIVDDEAHIAGLVRDVANVVITRGASARHRKVGGRDDVAAARERDRVVASPLAVVDEARAVDDEREWAPRSNRCVSHGREAALGNWVPDLGDEG